MSNETTLLRLPLDALHRELGAKMSGFAGWDMPVQYAGGLKAEHLHTRAQAGLFDVSHMGQLRVVARDGERSTLQRALEAALPLDFDGWPEGLQRYSVLLQDDGGIADDLMVVNLGDEVRIVVNAGNRSADLSRLRALCPNLSIEWVEAALLALQGPDAQHVLEALDSSAADMRFMQARTLVLEGAECLTSRSGYTGEDGYEISVPLAAADAVARRLLEHASVKPIGLGARDSLRLEAGLPLHGSDITGSTTPIEAGLNFAIARSRRRGGSKEGGFPGAPTVLAQLEQGVTRKLVGLRSDESVPIRAHARILDAAGQAVGEVTSGTVSPTLNRPVMLAYLRADILAGETSGLRAEVRDKRPAVSVTRLPFVEKRYKRD